MSTHIPVSHGEPVKERDRWTEVTGQGLVKLCTLWPMKRGGETKGYYFKEVGTPQEGWLNLLYPRRGRVGDMDDHRPWQWEVLCGPVGSSMKRRWVFYEKEREADGMPYLLAQWGEAWLVAMVNQGPESKGEIYVYICGVPPR